jgi:hypothetical protein
MAEVSHEEWQKLLPPLEKLRSDLIRVLATKDAAWMDQYRQYLDLFMYDALDRTAEKAWLAAGLYVREYGWDHYKTVTFLTLVALAGTEQLRELRETMMKAKDEYKFLFEVE